jgi:hypothetical protein
MKYLLVICLAVFTLSACNNQEDKFEIEGKFLNFEEKQVALRNIETREVMGTSNIDASGNIKIEGKVEMPVKCGLFLEGSEEPTLLFFLENQEIKVHADLFAEADNSVDAGKEEALHQKLKSIESIHINAYQTFMVEYNKLKKNTVTLSRKNF